MRAVFRLFVLSCLGIAAVACSESDDIELVTDAAGFSVGLIEQGDEPRVLLRVADAPGTTQAIRMVADQAITIEARGVSESVETTQTMDATYTVIGADADSISFETRYDGMTIDSPDPSADEVNQALIDLFVGKTATTQITDRGSIISLDFDLSDAELPDVGLPGSGLLLEQMYSSLEENAASMSVPTPVDPVGAGGSWTVSADMVIMGILMSVETTVTVTEVTDDQLVGTIDLTMTIHEGEFDPLDLGVTAQLSESQMTGTGTITYMLDGAIVPLVDMTTTGSMEMRVRGTTLKHQMERHQITTAR